MTRMRILLSLWTACVAAGLFPSAARGDDRLTVRCGTLPNFVFADDRLELSVPVVCTTDPPKHAKPEATPTRPATLRMTTRNAEQTVELAVPVYNHRSATAHFPVDFAQLAPGEEIFLRAEGQGFVAAETRVAVFDTTDAPENLNVRFDHFEDGEGRRVILRVPRPGDAAHRRWLPLRAAQELATPAIRNAALYGLKYGDDHYADVFRERLKPETPALLTALTANVDVPVFRLFRVTTSAQPKERPEVVYIFPGVNDILRGTPPEEYYMALQAICSVFDTRIDRPRRIVLATPPPTGDEERARHYSDMVKRVARERHATVADLSRIDTGKGGGLSQAYLPADAQARMVDVMLAAGCGQRDAWIFALPSAGFLLAALALLWLWRRARYRMPA